MNDHTKHAVISTVAILILSALFIKSEIIQNILIVLGLIVGFAYLACTFFYESSVVYHQSDDTIDNK